MYLKLYDDGYSIIMLNKDDEIVNIYNIYFYNNNLYYYCLIDIHNKEEAEILIYYLINNFNCELIIKEIDNGFYIPINKEFLNKIIKK